MNEPRRGRGGGCGSAMRRTGNPPLHRPWPFTGGEGDEGRDPQR
jgi:hypothetical protein